MDKENYEDLKFDESAIFKTKESFQTPNREPKNAFVQQSLLDCVSTNGFMTPFETYANNERGQLTPGTQNNFTDSNRMRTSLQDSVSSGFI